MYVISFNKGKGKRQNVMVKFKLILLGRGRRSTIVGVDAGVFFCGGLAAELVAADTALGTALPDRICRLGDPSVFVAAGPTD